MNLAERFMQRFLGLMRAHGCYQVVDKKSKRGKIGGQAKTLKEPVTAAVWSDHLSGKTGLGIVPINDEGNSWFGAIDVDVYDLNLNNLESRIRKAEIPLTVCRTKSGGAHLYLFLKEAASASLVRDKLMEWSVFLGYPHVEIYPKQSEIAGEDDVGSWINMPYFGGERTTRYAVVEGRNLSPPEFLDYADGAATTAEVIKKLKVKEDENLANGPPCLQYLAISGFPEGTRNMALYNLSIFCKMKYGDAWEEKAREFNKVYLIPPLSHKEVETIIKSIGKKTYFYKCKEPPIMGSCNRSICTKREYGLKKSGNDPGVTLDGMTKITTWPPMWVMNVDGRRIKMESSEDFLSQTRFTKVCVDSYNIVPNRISEPVWRSIIRDLLDKADEIEAPEDAGQRGEFMAMVEKFCTERPPAKNPEEMLTSRPYGRDDRIYFRAMDMLEWMRKKKFNITAREAWDILQDKGAKTESFKIKGKFFRAWSMPPFTTQTEPFEVPDIPGEVEEF